MNTYLCDEGNAEIKIQAETAEEAAQDYVYGCEWDEIESTSWINVWVQQVDSDGEEIGTRDIHTIALEPEEPDCSRGHDHEWQSPFEVVGGIIQNPGCWGHGGGVIITEVCAHCGVYRTKDTWATNPETGEQGLTSVSYEDADNRSQEWVRKIAANSSFGN